MVAENRKTIRALLNQIVDEAEHRHPVRAPDHRSDIFSFGVVLHEMLGGARPFEGETAVDIMQAILPAPATCSRPCP